MKKFAMVLCVLSSMMTWSNEGQSQEKVNKVVLSYCSNFGDGVSFSFSSCVNSNFTRLQGSLGGFYRYCSNFGDEVSFSYINCIQSNFRTAESNADGSLYLSYCSNFDRSRLSFSYVSCVNRNFNTIESYLRRQ